MAAKVWMEIANDAQGQYHWGQFRGTPPKFSTDLFGYKTGQKVFAYDFNTWTPGSPEDMSGLYCSRDDVSGKFWVRVFMLDPDPMADRGIKPPLPSSYPWAGVVYYNEVEWAQIKGRNLWSTAQWLWTPWKGLRVTAPPLMAIKPGYDLIVDVGTDMLRVRSEPVTMAPNTITRIPTGTVVHVIGERSFPDQTWNRVVLPDLTEGWCAAQYKGDVYLKD